MSNIIYLLVFALLSSISLAQENIKAWSNFENSTYESISQEDDAVILFDRSYIEVKNNYLEGISVTRTIHRKIKINTLYGLEQYNKLYIPVVQGIHSNSILLSCKAKTIHSNQEVEETENYDMITTSLPANASFFYKVEGKVKMLAIKGVKIGDEVEYIYSVEKKYDVAPIHFYLFDRIEFNENNYCLEKSIFINENYFECTIWKNNSQIKLEKNGNWKRISVNNIESYRPEIYGLETRDLLTIKYLISLRQEGEEIESWSDFVLKGKSKRREVKRSTILDGQNIFDFIPEINNISNIDKKVKFISSRINGVIENEFELYSQVNNDIHTSFAYYKILSKLFKKIKLPIQAYFVVSKYYGDFDENNFLLEQFDNIIFSYINNTNELKYFSILEPYSDINQIKKEFQGTKAFIIHQNEKGEKTHEFGEIPKVSTINGHNINFSIGVESLNEDSLVYDVTESHIFLGTEWLKVKPFILNIVSNEKKVNSLLQKFVLNNLVKPEVDSVHIINYEFSDSSFRINYNYNFSVLFQKSHNVLEFKPESLLRNNYYTPYYLKNQERKHPGYLFLETNRTIQFELDLSDELIWLENENLNQNFNNAFGQIISTYESIDNQLKFSIQINWFKDTFTTKDWGSIYDLRSVTQDFYFFPMLLNRKP